MVRTGNASLSVVEQNSCEIFTASRDPRMVGRSGANSDVHNRVPWLVSRSAIDRIISSRISLRGRGSLLRAVQ